MSAQLPLPLPHRVAHGREDFFVAAPNAEAVAWIDRWPDWPGPALIVHGPPGSGKSHLLSVWCERSGAVAADPDSLRRLGVARLAAAGRVAFDDAERLAEPRDLLHLFNLLAEARGHLLLGTRAPPARWGLPLADLVSRLKAAPTVALAPPDDDLLRAVLAKQFADRQVKPLGDVISYLLPRMGRTFEAAGRLVAALDRAAIAERRPISVRLAGEVLAQSRNCNE